MTRCSPPHLASFLLFLAVLPLFGGRPKKLKPTSWASLPQRLALQPKDFRSDRNSTDAFAACPARFRWVQETLDCWTSAAGRWVHAPAQAPLIPTVYSNDGGLRTKVYSACGARRKRPGLAFAWRPHDGCPPLRSSWTPAEICALMAGRHLVFIGDSISIHMGETFINAMGNRTAYGPIDGEHPHYVQPYDALCSAAGTPPFAVHIYCVTSLLHFPPAIFQQLAQLDMAGPGMVLVANWGAFYLPDGPFAKHVRRVVDWALRLRHTQFVFRSANMAHHGCEKHRQPLNDFPFLPADHPQQPNWHWRDFPLQSQHLVRPLLHRGQLYLDVLPLSQKRPDQHPGHGDCLHYCIPGPMDTWVLLLLATLQELAVPCAAVPPS
eukprot:EG_transcript_12978